MTNARRALRDYERSLNVSNNNTANATATTSFPVLTLAFAVLLVLKVAGNAGASWGLANLSWWVVFSPLLLGFGFFLLFLIIAFVVFLIADK